MCRRLDYLEKKVAELEVALSKDAYIAKLEDKLVKVELERYVDDKTCGLVRGETFIRPRQMADPYHGSANVISTHPRKVEVEIEHPCNGQG